MTTLNQSDPQPAAQTLNGNAPAESGISAPVPNADTSRKVENSNKAWSIKDAYHTHVPKDGDHWEACFRKMQKLDDEMCQGWRDEIDTMMIFAGLFSATVTAFVVESYKSLQEAPSDTLARLQLLQMGTSPSSAAITFEISATTVAINVLWFSSLALALSSALVGILCKQWLREYLRYEDIGGRKALPIREMRFKGLHGWHVPGIIAFLPLLLQAALVLFFTGILILLWTLQRVVAAVLTLIVGTTLGFLIITTLLPVIQWRFAIFKTQCAYKSPQSWAFILSTRSGSQQSSWTHYDSSMTNWSGYGDLLSGLRRFYRSFSQKISAVRNIYHCISDPSFFVPPSSFVATFDDKQSWTIQLLPSPRTEEFASYDIKKIEDEIAFGIFSSKLAPTDLKIFHRHAEHCVRLLDDAELIRDPNFSASILQVLSVSIKSVAFLSSPLEWHSAVASRLVSIFSLMFRNNDMPDKAVLRFWSDIFPSLLSYGSIHRDTFHPSPYTLFEEIGPWLSRYPNSREKDFRVEECLYGMRLIVTRGIDQMNAIELEAVGSFLPVLGVCSVSSQQHARFSSDLELLRRSFKMSSGPRPPLYSVSSGKTLETSSYGGHGVLQ